MIWIVPKNHNKTWDGIGARYRYLGKIITLLTTRLMNLNSKIKSFKVTYFKILSSMSRELCYGFQVYIGH